MVKKKNNPKLCTASSHSTVPRIGPCVQFAGQRRRESCHTRRTQDETRLTATRENRSESKVLVTVLRPLIDGIRTDALRGWGGVASWGLMVPLEGAELEPQGLRQSPGASHKRLG